MSSLSVFNCRNIQRAILERMLSFYIDQTNVVHTAIRIESRRKHQDPPDPTDATYK